MLARRDSTDASPDLVPLPGLTVRREHDTVVMATLQGRSTLEMADRFAAGHRAYVALLDDEPAAFGWVATRHATIGELAATFEIPARERYLWNFITLRAHRGKGIYPRLIDGIVRAELGEAERFWIAYAPENHASGAGIRKAGFSAVAELSFDSTGRPAASSRAPGGAATAARVLGLPLAAQPLSPCWRCARAASQGTGARPVMFCAEGSCTCDYQRPEVRCETATPLAGAR